MSFIINPYVFSPSNGLLTNLVSYYKFDSNGSFPDAHGSNNGTINGATFNATGKLNGAYDFDGTNDYISVDGLNLASSTFSITGWIKITTTATFDYFFDTNSPRLILGWDTTNSGHFKHFDGTAWRGSGFAINSGSWTFFALVKTGTGYKMRVDASTMTGTGTSISLSGTNSRIGSDNTSSSVFFQGSIDEMGFWGGRALSDTDLDLIYNSGAGLSYDSFTN